MDGFTKSVWNKLGVYDDLFKIIEVRRTSDSCDVLLRFWNVNEIKDFVKEFRQKLDFSHSVLDDEIGLVRLVIY